MTTAEHMFGYMASTGRINCICGWSEPFQGTREEAHQVWSAHVAAPADPGARGAASEVVKAVLNVTPIDPEGLVITGFVAIEAFDGGQLPTFGEPEPIAARQAAAVLRWAAEAGPAALGGAPWRWLIARADELDGGTDGRPT